MVVGLVIGVSAGAVGVLLLLGGDDAPESTGPERPTPTADALVVVDSGGEPYHEQIYDRQQFGWATVVTNTSDQVATGVHITVEFQNADTEVVETREEIVYVLFPGEEFGVGGTVERDDVRRFDVTNLQPGGWADPGRGATLRLTADPSDLLAALATAPGGPERPWLAAWLEAERLAREAIDGLLEGWTEPFEGRVARDLVGWMPARGTLVVGSSMPVRDVDAFARPRDGLRFVANRGLSGIDGFVATALGVAAAGDEPVAALCGDLTLLHDASTLLGAAGRPRGAVLVVCDNDGGGIFSFLPQAQLPGDLFEPLFGTPHGLDLTALAAVARARDGARDPSAGDAAR